MDKASPGRARLPALHAGLNRVGRRTPQTSGARQQSVVSAKRCFLRLISSASPSVSKYPSDFSPRQLRGDFLSVAGRVKLPPSHSATTQFSGESKCTRRSSPDLDGTLLNSQHQVSDLTRTTLKTLIDGGVKFIVATGRHIIDVQGIRQTMGFECELITSNGALVSAADDSLLFQYVGA